MEQILFGELGIRPWDLAEMTFREVILSIDGLRERDKMLEGWIRRATFIVASTNVGSKGLATKFDKMWPVEKGTIKAEERALDQLRKFRENAALKRAQKKLDAR